MPCRPMSCQCGKKYLPQRMLITFLAFMTIVILFNMRVALNLVINEMIPIKNVTESSDYCPFPAKKAEKSKSLLHKTKWTEMEQSFIRASFFIGYVPTHFPAGICSDYFGARIMTLVALGVSAIFTLVVPMILWFSENAYIVGCSRIMVGIGQGMGFPAVSSLVSKWIPPSERACLGSFALSGSHVGTIIGNALSGFLTASFESWQAPFYFHGASGLVFMLVVFVWVWTSPSDSPFIVEEEKEMLLNEVKPRVKHKVPIKAIMTDVVVWGMSIGELGHAWIFFTFSTDLPKYLSQVLHYDIEKNGLISALPSLGMWICSIISGLVNDHLYKKKYFRTVTLRRVSTALGNILPGAFCVAAGYAGCNVTLAVILLVLVLTSKGPFYTGIKVNYLDITTNHAGFVMSVNNGIGATTGFICPYVISWIAKDQSVPQWQIYFWLSFVMSILGTVPYWIMTDDKRRPWDYVEGEVPPTEG